MKSRLFSARACACAVPLLLAGCDRQAGLMDPAERAGELAASVASQRYSEWSAPVNLGPTVNSAFAETTPELSSDGLSLYFGSSRPGGLGSNDLWVSRRACTDLGDPACAWGEPVNLGPTVNSTNNDVAPHLSRDGHWLYLSSARPGGSGSNDLWVAWRADPKDDFAWETPVNLGTTVNSTQFEGGLTIREPEMYFNRGSIPLAPGAGPPSDIYVSRMRGDAFDPPVLVQELSSPGFDQKPALRFDALEIVINSDRDGTLGDSDLWVSTRRGRSQPWSTPMNLGAPINTAFRDQHAALSDDGTVLFFASDRPGGSGNLDIYVATRTLGGR